MQLIDGSLVLSPTDLAESVLCDHLVAVERQVAFGEVQRDGEPDPALEVLLRRSAEHEAEYLKSLSASGRSVVEIKTRSAGRAALEQAERQTLDAMRSGVDVIYHATFFDGRWRGQADFLERVDKPSDLGSFSYEVSDAKLARHAKVEALLQIANYSEHVARLQGRMPAEMHLILGTAERVTFDTLDFDSYYRSIKRDFEQRVEQQTATYPDPVAHCAICRWADNCDAQRVADDHLSLVADMGRHQTLKLNESGVFTLAQLASLDAPFVRGISESTLAKLHSQARLQAAQRESGVVAYELIEPGAGDRGFATLPPPSKGDLFFDMEGDPYVGERGIEYLFGVTEQFDDGLRYHSWWAHDTASEKRAFEAFIDFVVERRAQHPDLHIYHYAPYELSAIQRLSARHGTREVEVDALQRENVLVDLYRIVRQTVRVSQDSYSIKKLEPLYMGSRGTEVVGGGESIVAYETWLEVGDQKILDDIEQYNRDDCESTFGLRNWLEERRAEAQQQFGELPFIDEATTASAAVSKLDEQIDELDKLLCAELPESGGSHEQQTTRLLARLLEWHRREAKSEWWNHFRLLDLSDAELFDDRDALSGLEYEGVVGQVKQSLVYRYSFDPGQEHKIINGSPVDPHTRKPAGVIVAVDSEHGTIDLKRSGGSSTPHPTSLVPAKPVTHAQQQAALIEIGHWVAANGFDATEKFRALCDLLMRRTPRLVSGRTIQSVVSASLSIGDAACELVDDLDDSYLAIQGPPGAGKTYTGAEMVLRLIRSGKRVGVTATSHKVVGNLLCAIAEHAERAGVDVRVMQKPKEGESCAHDDFLLAKDNQTIAATMQGHEVDVVGGTAWLFSRAELREAFDVLIVDEAGQMSLADVLAVGTSAKSIVLLGDPQQLAQPSKGVHPDGAEKSSLEHLLGEHQTMPAHLGLLLDTSWRMHPDVCSFVSEAFYDARLKSVSACASQRVVADSPWGGTGLRYLPVAHMGNRTSSIEEVHAIAAGVAALVGRTWVDSDGSTRAITLDDILIVAPYNAQVLLLKAVMPDGARIGTVDKFQGQEAAVVFYSMAVSSAEDISRGIDFLFSRNRLNVAVSRARCLAVLVGSQELLTVACRTPQQARLVNTLCSFVEHAEVIELST